jgi:hypothetical protein
MRRFELLCGAAPGREKVEDDGQSRHPPMAVRCAATTAASTSSAPASAYWPPRKNYVHNDRPSMARRSDLIGGRCLKCTSSRQRKMLAKRTRFNFVIGEVSRLPFERRIAPCSDDRMKSPTSSHLKSCGSSPALTAAFKQAASES